MEPANCFVDATQDLIGVGVRVGLYCQWLATFISGIALPSELNYIQTTTICFQTATLIALVVITAHGVLIAQEVLVALPLVFGGFLATHIFDPPQAFLAARGNRENSSTSFWRLFATVQVFGLLIGYNSWFWWQGVNVLHSDACRYYTLVFTKVEVLRLWHVGVVLGTLAAVLFVLLDAILLIWVTLVVFNAGLRVALENFVRTRIPSLINGSDRPLWAIWLACLVRVLSMVYVATMIELTIGWCYIRGANTLDSAGQIIPLVLGVTGLIKVLYGIVKEVFQA